SEASSNVVLEAMGTGLPVVATRVGGLPGLVEDESNGLLVPPDDVPALAQAIMRLLETPGLAAKMGARGRVRALAEFSLERMSEPGLSSFRQPAGSALEAPDPGRPRLAPSSAYKWAQSEELADDPGGEPCRPVPGCHRSPHPPLRAPAWICHRVRDGQASARSVDLEAFHADHLRDSREL